MIKRSELMKHGFWKYITYTKEDLLDIYGMSHPPSDLKRMEGLIYTTKLEEGDPLPSSQHKVIRIYPHPGKVETFHYLEGTCMEDIVLKKFEV